jgi:hypothetical protein
MFPGLTVPEHRQIATKRIAVYSACVSVLFLAIVWFGLLQRTQASENILPDHQVHAAATRIQPKLAASYGKLPLGFEANQGQVRGPVKFLSRGPGYTIFLTDGEAVLALRKSSVVSGQSSVGTRQNPGVRTQEPEGKSGQRATDNGARITASVLRMKLVGANAKAEVTGAQELPGKSNYFIGNDPKKWRTNVPTYAKVSYQGVYPGVGLIYYGNQGGQLEYDFVVAPGADPAAIGLALGGGLEVGSGQSAVGSVAQNRAQRQSKIQNLDSKIDPSGDLVVKTDGGEIRFQKPVVYQPPINNGQRTTDYGQRTPVDGRYVLHASNQVGFKVGSYDRTRPLFIDPVLSYSTYLGGSGVDSGAGIAVDSAGNAYVTGTTGSTDFPTANPLQATNHGSGDAFVTKLNAAGSALVYSTYLGGSGSDQGNGIAVDSSGDAYVTGQTWSTDFPTVNPLQATNKESGANWTAFVAKLNPAGSALVYSTYLGGSGYYYSASAGNSGYDEAFGIAADSAGNAYVTGSTRSSDFPTANPLQPTCGGCSNGFPSAFVAKLNPAGSALVYSTYLGGSGGGLGDSGSGIAVDAAGNAYVTGMASSTNFPTADPLQPTCGACPLYETAFVAELNPIGSALVYSTYLGGSNFDMAAGIAVDSADNAYVTGWTQSRDFPTVNPLQSSNDGNENAFVAKLNPAGSALVYSTYLGGSGMDQGSGIAADTAGNAYVTGTTSSTDFPTANPLQATMDGPSDAFVAKLNAAGSALVYSTYLGGSGGDQGLGIAVDPAGNAYVTGATGSTDFPTVNPFQATNNSPQIQYMGVTGFVAKIGAVTISPTSLSFSSQTVGATSPAQPVTLSNIGNANLTISSIAIGGSNSGDFAAEATGTTCSTSAALAAGTNCTINVTFSPTAAGPLTGTLAITDSSDGQVGSTQTVTLSGTGTAPLVSLSAPGLSFGPQFLSTTSAAQAETVTNTGAANLTIFTVTIGGTNASDFATSADACTGATVTPDGTCTVSVTFTPSATGSRSASLNFTDNASNSPQAVTLSGTGMGPFVSLSSSSLTFSAEIVGNSGGAQAVTLTNTGKASLAISSITASGDFSQTNTCGATVSVGANCTISMTFKPVAAGTRTGTISISDNALDSPQSVALSGMGQDFMLAPASGSSTSDAVAPGQSATYTLTLAGEWGFNQSLSLSCTGAPSEATCTVPNPVTVGSSATNVTVTVTTTAPSVSVPRSRPLPPVPPLSPGLRGLVMLALVLTAMAWAIGRRHQPGVSRWKSALVPLASALLLTLALAGCGGAGSSFNVTINTGTPAGTYTLTVTGSTGSGSSALSHSVTLTLTVD